MSRNGFVRRGTGLALSILSAAMIGLAAGAVWMVLSVYTRSELIWLIAPLGVVIGWSVAAGVAGSRWSAAILSALATILAVVYVRMLLAAMQIAGLLGLSFGYALKQAGIGMLWSMAEMSFSSTLLLMLLAGVMLSVLACLWQKHRARR